MDYKTELNRHSTLVTACYIRTYICMNGKEEFSFWIDFLQRCPDYLRIVGLDMDSPLFTGNGDSMKKVMKFLEKVRERGGLRTAKHNLTR